MTIRLTVTSAVDAPNDINTVDFDDFTALYETVKKTLAEGEKTDSELIVPVSAWIHPYRADKNVKMMSRVFCCDIDAKPQKTIDSIMLHLSTQKLSFFAYTSHSHLQPVKHCLPCWRIVIELNREYGPENHKKLWDWINDCLLLKNNDLGTRKISLAYYLPQTPVGKGHLFDCVIHQGEPLDIDAVLATTSTTTPAPVPAPAPTPSQPPPSIHALETILTAWLRQTKDMERKTVAKAARALLRGTNEIALHSGQRNNFLISLAGYLAARFPEAKNIASQFAGIGWDLFNQDAKYPIESFQDMIDRCQIKELEKLAEARERAIQERRENIRLATRGERDHEITDDEIAHLKKTFGGKWIEHILAIHKKDIYFLRPDGTYDPNPVLRESVFVAAKTRLAVFGDYIEYTYLNARGDEVRKGPQAFLEEYGHVARRVLFDMGRPHGGYDMKEEWVYLQTAIPKVDPAYSGEVQAWFETLGGHFIDMMAALPRLTEMCPALVLTGKASTGKTLAAVGVGQIYGHDPVDGESVFTQFNASALIDQPIVFMDEKVSGAYEREGTTLIRKWVTQRSRKLDEKYQAKVELLGYPRLIVAANNDNILATRQDMSDDDYEAFAERLVHVHMDPGAGYLAAIGKPRIQKEWLDRKALAKHILWLNQNHQIQNPGSRFLVRANDTNLHDGLVIRSGDAGSVAYWLLLYLDSPERAKHLPISYDPEKMHLRVNPKAVVDGWGLYLKNHRSPAPSIIGAAVRSLSLKNKQKITVKENGRSKTWNAWQIDPRKFRPANEVYSVLENFDKMFGLWAPPA